MTVKRQQVRNSLGPFTLTETNKPVGGDRRRICMRELVALLSMINNPDASRPVPSSPASEAGLEEARLRQQAIGVKLRHMFDQVVNEPVPDEFLEILRRADEKSSRGSAE